MGGDLELTWDVDVGVGACRLWLAVTIFCEFRNREYGRFPRGDRGAGIGDEVRGEAGSRRAAATADMRCPPRQPKKRNKHTKRKRKEKKKRYGQQHTFSSSSFVVCRLVECDLGEGARWAMEIKICLSEVSESSSRMRTWRLLFR